MHNGANKEYNHMKKSICLLTLIYLIPNIAFAAKRKYEEPDHPWAWAVQASYFLANPSAPEGKITDRGSYPTVGDTVFHDHRYDLFKDKASTMELQVGYAKKNMFGIFLGGTMINDAKKSIPDAGTVLNGNIVGPKLDIETSASYYNMYLIAHINYPKVTNWVMYWALNLVTFGFGGTALSYLKPAFYLDVGPEINFAKLEYSGDVNASENYFGFGLHMGFGMEFNITEKIQATIGRSFGFSLSQFIGDDDGFTNIYGTRLGIKYYF